MAISKENVNAERSRIKYDVDFNAVKTAIRKSYSLKSIGLGFHIDYNVLDVEVANYGLTCVYTNPDSKLINVEDVTGIAEFYKGPKLLWLTDRKEFANIIFIKTESIDDIARELLEKLKKPQVEDPSFDRIEAVAKILAEYPCYTAICISYRSNDPKRHGLVGMEISMRASTVTIKNDNYRYRAEDMVGYSSEPHVYGDNG